MIFLQLAHDFDGLQQLARVELAVGEGDQARGAVIGEVNKDVVFGSAAQKLERPRDEVEICCYVRNTSTRYVIRVNKLLYSVHSAGYADIHNEIELRFVITFPLPLSLRYVALPSRTLMNTSGVTFLPT